MHQLEGEPTADAEDPPTAGPRPLAARAPRLVHGFVAADVLAAPEQLGGSLESRSRAGPPGALEAWLGEPVPAAPRAARARPAARADRLPIDLRSWLLRVHQSLLRAVHEFSDCRVAPLASSALASTRVDATCKG